MRLLSALIAAFLPLSAIDQLAPDSRNGTESIRVAIFGDSRGDADGDGSGINQPVLVKLLRSIKTKEPKALFATGNLVLGMGPGKNETKSPWNKIAPPPDKDIYGNNWKKRGLVYSTSIFSKQLNLFSRLLKENLGSLPFYPLVGYNEALGPDAVQLFADHFHIQNARYFDQQLAYTVAIGNAYFVLFSSYFYDEKTKGLAEHNLSVAFLEWLDNELKSKAAAYPFIFVLGHEPAFSTTSASGDYRGLDNRAFLRDIFWRILQENQVVAYIASHEHLYDRSDRQGVWQVISGGAGASLTKRNVEKAFYHYLLLEIPTDRGENPRIRVIDINGNTRDFFELKTKREPIYQLRISSLLKLYQGCRGQAGFKLPLHVSNHLSVLLPDQASLYRFLADQIS